MKRLRPIGVVLLLAFVAQGCATVSNKKLASKKKRMPPKQSESYALMDDDSSVDEDIMRRGNMVRGISEY